MADSIIEQIVAAIKTGLEGITIAGGYNQTIVEVVRPTRLGGFKPRDLLIVMDQQDPTLDEEAPHMFIQWIQPIAISVFVISSDTSTAAIDTRINTVRSDIEKCLRVDPTWSQLAIDTRISAALYFPENEGGYSGITIIADVIYRTLEDDPFSQ